jgi:initiation factor 1A
MPNLRGGKAYKKGKRPTEPQDTKFVGRDADQDYARVIRMLGNRYVTCFCNDGKERKCKIRGAMCKGPKKQIIEVDDIVLISFRNFGADSSSENDKEPGVADIIGKIDRSNWKFVKKEIKINSFLFNTGTAVDDLFEQEPEQEQEPDKSDDEPDIDAI